MREFFPSNLQESDLALRVRLELLEAIVVKVGPERFLEAVKMALSLARSRYDVTPLKISECAGLQSFTVSPSVRAWSFVMNVVHRHVRPAPEGGYRLEEYVYRSGDEIVTVPVPTIPDNVLQAVRTIGGWAALKEADPQYIGQRMRDFKEVFETNTATTQKEEPNGN